MKSIWFETRIVLVAGGLLIGGAGIAWADALSIPAPDLAVTNADDSCDSDLSSCEDAARKFASPPTSHLHKKQFAHHRFARRRPVIVAAHQQPRPDQVALEQLTCTGANAWSLLCPGAQVIGISY